MRLFLERCTLTLINIFLPPLSVMLVAGVGVDALINTLLFLAGVLPGHAHGLYVTWTYFSRKRKVRKGRYPGGPKPLLYSRRVTNGDASDETVRRLWEAEQRAREEKLGVGVGVGTREGGGAGGGSGRRRRRTRDSTGHSYHSRGSRSPRY